MSHPQAVIAVISDTHGYLGQDVIDHCQDATEIWHAGDIGDLATAEKIESIGKPVRMVWGNIDGAELRSHYPLDQRFVTAGLDVFMTHIGGYPPKLYKRVRSIVHQNTPDLYICGHSHILKVMRDKQIGYLHMNPGACGIKGFHKFRTMLKFDIVDGQISNLRAIELGLRSQ
ncbi:MAG: metallophosphoesterase family protein, partial [Bacteroidota bacterium]